MAVTDKLKGMVEELRQDLNEVKEQVRQLLPLGKDQQNVPVRRPAADHPIVALQQETNRLFDDFFRGSTSPLDGLASFAEPFSPSRWPRLDIDESARELRVRADVAGVDRKDVDVSVADGVLTIRGETSREQEDQGRRHFRRERFFGSFSRSFQIPADVDLDAIQAKMSNGVLDITMPKLGDRRTRGRRISITPDKS